jgi:hypothetical protein
VRRQWRETTLPVLTIRQATEPTPEADRGDEMSPALKGHALGGILETSVEGGHHQRRPRHDGRVHAPRRQEAGDWEGPGGPTSFCIRARSEVWDSEHQHDTLLAAYVISSSCANLGVVVQAAPTATAHVPDARLRHILRVRFGVPCVMPLDQWRCNCSAHAGPRTVRSWSPTTGTRPRGRSPPRLCMGCTAGDDGYE